MEGYITYADLKNGNVNLYDIYVLNTLIEFKAEQKEKIKKQALLKRVAETKKG